MRKEDVERETQSRSVFIGLPRSAGSLPATQRRRLPPTHPLFSFLCVRHQPIKKNVKKQKYKNIKKKKPDVSESSRALVQYRQK